VPLELWEKWDATSIEREKRRARADESNLWWKMQRYRQRLSRGWRGWWKRWHLRLRLERTGVNIVRRRRRARGGEEARIKMGAIGI
jgi:hypothetical protein